MTNTYIIRPLFDEESYTWTYIVMDKSSMKAAIIDSVAEQHNRDLKLLEEIGATLSYIFETHVHADHVTGASLLKEKTGAQIALGACAKNNVSGADIFLEDGEDIIMGSTTIKALATPGHTDCCTSYFTGDSVFTGDTLFIRGCGRTDFQVGNPATLYKSIHEKLFTLPDDTRVYPGHDYKGMLYSTIGEEKKHNPRLKLENSEENFINIMNNLKLDSPKKMDIAVPANMELGGNYKVG